MEYHGDTQNGRDGGKRKGAAFTRQMLQNERQQGNVGPQKHTHWEQSAMVGRTKQQTSYVRYGQPYERNRAAQRGDCGGEQTGE